ncbi:MAG: hypothetical protein V1822_01850 [Candidatus Micrarchaeota archaeon]
MLEKYEPLKLSLNPGGREISKMCYGVGVSPYKEPMEQFDALLILRAYNSVLCDYALKCAQMPQFISLSILIAGKYNILNLRQNQDPYEAYKQWGVQEQNKKKLFLQAASNLAVGEYVQILQTDELWSDKRYWDILVNLSMQKYKMPNYRKFGGEPLKFGEIPRSLLGGITMAQREYIANERACSLYMYAQIAEALYLQNYFGIGAKIGPASEEEYDKYLRCSMSVVQFLDPAEFSSTPKNIRCCASIGKKGQARFWANDAKKNGELGEYAKSMVAGSLDYPGGPIEQWRNRILLYEGKIGDAELENSKLGGEQLAQKISEYIRGVAGGLYS